MTGTTTSATHRPKVVYWFDEISPNAVERLNAVSERGDVEIEAWFNRSRGDDRSWDTSLVERRFRHRFIPARRFLLWDTHIPARELRDTRPDLFIQDFDRPVLLLGFLAAKVWAKRTAFRVLPRIGPTGRRTWYGECAKHFMFRAVDWAKVYGRDGAALAMRYGLPGVRTTHVTQSVSVEVYRSARDIEPATRAQRRSAYGLDGCVFLFVGRLVYVKGLDTLLRAYERVARTADVSLLVVGDGADEDKYRAAARGLPNVAFSGFVQAPELPEIFALADVMVFPTRGDGNGLVVEEAFAAGLPVISSTRAGNIDVRISEGVNGFVVPAEDSVALAQRMEQLALNEQVRKGMAGNAAASVSHVRHTEYARDFSAFAAYATAAPARKSVASWVARQLGHVVAGVNGRRPGSWTARGVATGSERTAKPRA